MLRRGVIICFWFLISFIDTYNIPLKSPVCLMHPTYRPQIQQTKSCNPISIDIKAQPDSFLCTIMDDPNRRERRIDGRSGFLSLKDDPDLITEDDLANPWTLASLLTPTGEYLRWLMEHGFLQSLVTCGNPNCDLPCTLQLSLAIFFLK